MRFFSLPTLLAAAFFSVVISIPFFPLPEEVEHYTFRIEVESDTAGFVQVYYDIGRGLNEADSSKLAVSPGADFHLFAFPLPLGSYRTLRFDPIDRTGRIEIRNAGLYSPGGRLVRRFPPSDFIVKQQIAELHSAGRTVQITTTPGADDPITLVRTSPPLNLTVTYDVMVLAYAKVWLPRFLGCLFLLAAAGWALQRNRDGTVAGWEKFRSAALSRPKACCAAMAAMAAIAGSYPVLLFGKSFVSPNLGNAVLLYEAFPTLPGYKETEVADVKGSDVGAIMWQHIPWSILQHDALFRDRELPLWNRYNSEGSTLLGQGQSMLGDPLHLLLPVLFRGAAWAWDLKYVIAKWLLGFGLGLIVWRTTRHLPASLIVAFTAEFTGFFIYRVNHPAIFSFCYAPWILLCWIAATQAPNLSSSARWAVGLILANWCEMTSGTAKEAYMLLLSMNLTGMFILLADRRRWSDRGWRLAVLGWCGFLFVLISRPIWLTFLDSLHSSYTPFADARAYQIRPSLLIGLFDEIFYRPFNEREFVYNPSSNFVLLLGLLAYLIYFRANWENRVGRGVAWGAVPALALAFGLVPPDWIVKVPFLGNVAHIDNTFSCVLILQFAVLAGIGFQAAGGKFGRPEGRLDAGMGLVLLGALIFPYVAFTQAVQRSTHSFLHWGESIPRSPFVWVSLAVLPTAVVGLALTARRALVRRWLGPAEIFLMAAFAAVLLWRFGQERHSRFDGYVINPTNRVDFTAKSEAVAAILSDKSEPFRVFGTGDNLFPGWSDVYGLESINGPEAVMNPYNRELQDAFGFERVWPWRLQVYAQTLAPLLPFYDFLNIKYVVDYRGDRDLMSSLLTPVKMADLDVYLSPTAWPRAFFTDQLLSYRTPADLAGLVRDDGGKPFAAIQADEIEAPSPTAMPPADRVSISARNYLLTTNRTAFTIQVSKPGFVVLSESYIAKDFRAIVNGRPAKYFRVNHVFKGLKLDHAGTYRIEFAYWPHHLTLALWLSAAGLAGAGATLWATRVLSPPLTITSRSTTRPT